MSDQFTFTVPGQPLSWNRSYKSKTIRMRDALGHVRSYPSTYKTQVAKDWQDAVRTLCRVAKPTGWKATEVIVAYDLILARMIDCDNVMKMANDAIARAIDLDDRYFYPVVMSKVSGSKDPHIMVTVYDRANYGITISTNSWTEYVDRLRREASL